MLCDICQAKQAKIFYTEIVNGQKKEQHLCEDCASEYTAVPLSELMGAQQLPIGSILSGILSKYAKDSVENENGNGSPVKRIDVQCPECGMTESEFLKMGRLGCPVCYSAFSNLITKNFKTMQGGLQHMGKEPVHAKFIEVSEDMPRNRVPLTPAADGVDEKICVQGADTAGKKEAQREGKKKASAALKETDRLAELKKQLQEALEKEDYESAARLRDAIRGTDGKKEPAEIQKTVKNVSKGRTSSKTGTSAGKKRKDAE